MSHKICFQTFHMIVFKYCSNLKTNIAFGSTIAARFTALVLLAFDFGFDWLNIISHNHLRYLPHHCLAFLKLSRIKMIPDPSSSWLLDGYLKLSDEHALRFDHLDYPMSWVNLDHLRSPYLGHCSTLMISSCVS